MFNLKDSKRGVVAIGVVAILLGSIFVRKFTNVKEDRNVVLFTEPEDIYASESEYDYYYNNKLVDLIDGYEIELDFNKPLGVQYINDKLSVHDYLSTYALDKVRYNHSVLSHIAEEDDEWIFKNEDDKTLDELYEAYLSGIKKDHELANEIKRVSFDKYLKNRFGQTITEESLKEIFSRDLIVKNYINNKRNVNINDDEVKRIYEENKDKFAPKKYMFYDIAFDNIDEKETAEKKAFELFDVIVDEESFVDAVKVVDKDIQNAIKEDGLTDEDIADKLTSIATIDDGKNFTNEWLYSEEKISPKSSAILISSSGEKNNKGIYRVIFFVDNVEESEELAFNFDKVFISKKIYKDTAEEKVVQLLKEIDGVSEDDYEELITLILNDLTNERTKDIDEKGRYRNVKESTLKNNGYTEVLDFLRTSELLEHTTIEGEEGYTIIINRGDAAKVDYKEDIFKYIRNIELNEFLKDIYKYAEDFKLVVGSNNKPYININMGMYKNNSVIDQVLASEVEVESNVVDE